MMLKNTEKPAFTKARAVRVCQKVMTVSDMKQKKLYIYGIMRKSGHGDYMAQAEFFQDIHAHDVASAPDTIVSNDSRLEKIKVKASNWKQYAKNK